MSEFYLDNTANWSIPRWAMLLAVLPIWAGLAWTVKFWYLIWYAAVYTSAI